MESVAIDSVIRVNSVNTNDTLINDVWGLDSNHGVDASVAWPISQNASEVIVAVIDSGIDPNHPDLLDAIWINTKLQTMELMMITTDSLMIHMDGILQANTITHLKMNTDTELT